MRQFLNRFFLKKKNSFKLLHICYHEGCVGELEAIAQTLGIDLVSWNVHRLRPYFFDPEAQGGNLLYNLGRERAQRIWKKHCHFFNRFDAIITSDITAVSRIFLENGWTKPLILWISSRFDWSFHGETDCDFPDQAYYELLRLAKSFPNVRFVPSTPFEICYAKQKGVDLSGPVIAACAYSLYRHKNSWPSDPVKNQQLFIHQRTEEVQLHHMPSFRISEFLQKRGVPAVCYRYKTLTELQVFKGVLYLPYQWYIISFFEVLRLGVPIYVPSQAFLLELLKTMNYYFENREFALEGGLLPIAEWYAPPVQEIVTYFDSWKDLKIKLAETNSFAIRQKSIAYALEHQEKMLGKWRDVFQSISV